MLENCSKKPEFFGRDALVSDKVDTWCNACESISLKRLRVPVIYLTVLGDYLPLVVLHMSSVLVNLACNLLQFFRGVVVQLIP